MPKGNSKVEERGERGEKAGLVSLSVKQNCVKINEATRGNKKQAESLCQAAGEG